MSEADEKVQIVCFNKCGLPVPIVVFGDNGEFVIQSLEPAGRKKLGVRIGTASEVVRKRVTSVLLTRKK